MLTYLSVCSGIEAASVAWRPLGWKAAAFSEIEPFPSAVLAHHYPEVPNLGDMTRFQEWPDLEPDVLVGGTPCQSFSVAGLRGGLDDPRGELMLVYGAIARRYRPRWLVWENVPGVLSSNGGRDFGTFLGMLAELGYGFAYRVLDAQYFGLAQRRRRVFVVGHLGDWRRAAAVLFERASLRGDSPPSREAREDVAGTVTRRTCSSVEAGVAPTLQAGGNSTGGDRPPGTTVDTCDSLIPVGVDFQNVATTGAVCGTLMGEGGQAGHGVLAIGAVAFAHQAGGTQTTLGYDPGAATAPTLISGQTPALHLGAAVRRLTPRECARLQGFPDDYLDIPYRGKPAADGPKYKALGNSMAVPVMRWIGERIATVEANFAAEQVWRKTA